MPQGKKSRQGRKEGNAELNKGVVFPTHIFFFLHARSSSKGNHDI